MKKTLKKPCGMKHDDNRVMELFNNNGDCVINDPCPEKPNNFCPQLGS